MPDDNTTSPSPAPIGDTSSGLAVGLALGVALGTLINNLATGIGTGIAIGAACAIARRKGSRRWVLWLGLYAVVVLVAFVLRLAGVLK
jgi:F0F1-type ATP synthase membrane subunit c/vacuolar-type H+-ATPase subunit K